MEKNTIKIKKKKRWNTAICDKMDGPWEYYFKWNKSVRKKLEGDGEVSGSGAHFSLCPAGTPSWSEEEWTASGIPDYMMFGGKKLQRTLKNRWWGDCAGMVRSLGSAPGPRLLRPWPGICGRIPGGELDHQLSPLPEQGGQPGTRRDLDAGPGWGN